MQKKLMEWKERAELKKAKKGAISIETLVVAGVILALAVGLLIAFSTTATNSSDSSNEAVDDATQEAMGQAGDNLSDPSESTEASY